MTGSTLKRVFALLVLFASSAQCRKYFTDYYNTNVDKTFPVLENSYSQILDELSASIKLRQSEEASQSALQERLVELIGDIETSNDQGLLDNDALNRNKAALSEVALAVEKNRDRIASLFEEQDNLYAQERDVADEIYSRYDKEWKITLAQSDLEIQTVKVHRYYKACEHKMVQLQKALTSEAQHEANLNVATMQDGLAREQIVLRYRQLQLLEAKDDGNYTDSDHQRLKEQERSELAAHATRTRKQMNVLRRKLGDASQLRRIYQTEMDAMKKEKKRMQDVRDWHRKNAESARSLLL